MEGLRASGARTRSCGFDSRSARKPRAGPGVSEQPPGTDLTGPAAGGKGRARHRLPAVAATQPSPATSPDASDPLGSARRAGAPR